MGKIDEENTPCFPSLLPVFVVMLREVRTGVGALVASKRQGTKAIPGEFALKVRGRRP